MNQLDFDVPQQSEGGPGRPRRRMRWWIIVPAAALFVGLIVVLVWGGLDNRTATEGSGATRPGKEAPAFTLRSFEDGELSLSDFEGEAVVINFWASWCLPCREEMPALEATWNAYRDRGLVIIGVNTPRSDPEPQARAFLEEFGVTYPNVFDTDGFTAIDYGVSGIPVTFFVDRDGIVARRYVGTLTPDSLVVWVEDLLAEG